MQTGVSSLEIFEEKKYYNLLFRLSSPLTPTGIVLALHPNGLQPPTFYFHMSIVQYSYRVLACQMMNVMYNCQSMYYANDERREDLPGVVDNTGCPRPTLLLFPLMTTNERRPSCCCDSGSAVVCGSLDS